MGVFVTLLSRFGRGVATWDWSNLTEPHLRWELQLVFRPRVEVATADAASRLRALSVSLGR